VRLSVSEQPHPDRFQILSLDGGGLKGLFSAALLAALEEDLGVVVADHFDLIVGTSTGGIIALALGAGIRPADIVDFYVSEGRAVFGHGRALFGRIRHARHRPVHLRAALHDVFGDRRLGESTKRLVIPSYSITEQDVYLFKTPHHGRFYRDGRELMVDVAMATSAAPTFLPAFHLRNNRLVDGGVWANNPTLVGVVEAVSVLDQTLDDIHVLSLGTTDELEHPGDALDDGGLLQWGRHVGSLLRAQALGTFHAAEHLIGPDHILRVDPVVPKGLFGLDRVDGPAIRGLAEGVARRTSPAVRAYTEYLPLPVPPHPGKDPVDER
jgi:hypothetical protein